MCCLWLSWKSNQLAHRWFSKQVNTINEEREILERPWKRQCVYYFMFFVCGVCACIHTHVWKPVGNVPLSLNTLLFEAGFLNEPVTY